MKLIILLLLLSSCAACPPTEIEVRVTPDINVYLSQEIKFWKTQLGQCAAEVNRLNAACPDL